MNFNLAGYKLHQTVAIVSAIVLHAGIVAGSLLSSAPTVINQQTIQVSFVAPSAEKKSSTSNFQKKIIETPEQKNALKQQKKSAEYNPDQLTKSNQNKPTSGREDPNATATKAAESEPIFNAAYLNNPPPVYPSSSRRRGVQGKVLLKVVVKIDGTADSIEISRSSGHQELDDAAMAAVKEWKFVPATHAGRLIQANVIVPIEFKII